MIFTLPWLISEASMPTRPAPVCRTFMYCGVGITLQKPDRKQTLEAVLVHPQNVYYTKY